jgi:predicted transposase/invertase (TIGR01784 family)
MDYDKSLKKKWDDYSIQQTAYNEGKLEQTRAIARELLKNGVSMDLITKSTGLSEEEIAEIAKIKE